MIWSVFYDKKLNAKSSKQGSQDTYISIKYSH